MSAKHNGRARARDIPFDLIVIGAGINGAGIARDAAARGLRVALVEKEDIASGTSSWSGRLIHGGLRYLEQGDVRLVRESLRERELLFRLAPHLVKPVPLMMPFYSKNKRPPWMIRAGMIAYDILSFDKTPPRHRVLSRDETIRRFPGMSPEGLDGSAIFYDGQVVWSERLCVETVLAAHADGAAVFTYSRVEELIHESGRAKGVRYTDALTGERHELRGEVVVNVAGPWVDAVLAGTGRPARQLIGGTKGSHLVVDRFPGAPTDVVYYESQRDGRLVLVIPWGRYNLIGTTDIRFDGEPDEARAEKEEMDYLLSEVNRLIPEAGLTPDDVLFTYSGVRPLPYAPDKFEGSVPRSHVIIDHAPDVRNLLSIVGGKLTTYRSLAEETVDKVFRLLGRKPVRSATRNLPLPGARVADLDRLRAELVETDGMSGATVERLVEVYGSRAIEVWEIGDRAPELLEPFDQATGAIGAELVLAFRDEFARTLTDALVRRTMVGMSAGNGLESVERAAEILAGYFGWSDDRVRGEVAGYRKYIRRFEVVGREPERRASRAGESPGLKVNEEGLEP
ncbi:glycerol-3-phosphate dehydrogenase [Rubrobacter indicoceani]|uniref:glycerol-3-phosphate dehydrogenase n=1 Tax=Rubrobacter indicoceani TaxID=2051957 RepID=UPI000E5AC872|nr:glycerol-3-phosphate dehydrogenase [Rubrobacter indicoceani]